MASRTHLLRRYLPSEPIQYEELTILNDDHFPPLEGMSSKSTVRVEVGAGHDGVYLVQIGHLLRRAVHVPEFMRGKFQENGSLGPDIHVSGTLDELNQLVLDLHEPMEQAIYLSRLCDPINWVLFVPFPREPVSVGQAWDVSLQGENRYATVTLARVEDGKGTLNVVTREKMIFFEDDKDEPQTRQVHATAVVDLASGTTMSATSESTLSFEKERKGVPESRTRIDIKSQATWRLLDF